MTTTIVVGTILDVKAHLHQHGLDRRDPDLVTISHPSAIDRLWGRRGPVDVHLVSEELTATWSELDHDRLAYQIGAIERSGLTPPSEAPPEPTATPSPPPD